MKQRAASEKRWESPGKRPVNRNIAGDYSPKELKNFHGTFNASGPREIPLRVRCLAAMFSAVLIRQISVAGIGSFTPERFSDLGKVFLGTENEADDFFNRKRIALLAPYVAAYNPEPTGPCALSAEKSRWNRIWQIHVRNIKSLELIESSDAYQLVINL